MTSSLITPVPDPAELLISGALVDAPPAHSGFPTDLALGPGVGVVAPFDFALDRELWRWVPDEISLYLTRLPFTPLPMTVELASVLAEPDAVVRATRDVLVPEPSAVTYACTSGSFVAGSAGERRLRAAMVAAGAPVATTSSGALIEALGLLGIRRVALATPYVCGVTDRLREFLGEHRVDVVAERSLGLIDRIWQVSFSEVVRAVQAVDTPDAEAVFVSCTNVRTYELIAPLEAALGKPVLTANQVTMWATLRAIGVAARGRGQALLDRTAEPLPAC
ncbi:MULTISPECIES: Asp/Glu racemase [Actinoalloteichus]|uniref:Maleate cis-trans isomerase n=1 Tax=Actinoalloteichus fjordicus TaxID=1612552 RepID=A0AAC9LG41_9PSEU|nr:MULTISPECIES: Asp/Glu racemase [Actinoalloteichus]APU16721.1 maleate cis-trans isomerase [Actinoalloteichus fjordicus]APU22787.1 maleate cis-trans isomerase [Actinoalloteichus sp. GBA129-24]